MPMQRRRTATPNAAPTGLLEGQLGVEMASTPPKLWVGVPTSIDPSGRRLLLGNQIVEAPTDGFTYGRLDNNWVQVSAGRWVPLAGGPLIYTATLTPALTAYTNGLAITVVPNRTNEGAVQVNLGPGNVAVLRNDGQPLQPADWDANVPQLLFFFGSAFYASGILKSQVPIVRTGDVDVWIRGSDGNDNNDGADNTPTRAFRTIQGAWNAIQRRFSSAPGLNVVMRLATAGTYTGAGFSNFQGNFSIRGTRGATQISPVTAASGIYGLQFGNMGNATVDSVDFLQNRATGSVSCLQVLDSNVIMSNCDFISSVGNPNASYIAVGLKGFLRPLGVIQFVGNNHQCLNVFNIANLSYFGSPPGAAQLHHQWTNATGAIVSAASQCIVDFGGITVTGAGSGMQFALNSWSFFNSAGQPVIGSVAGGAWNSLFA